MRRAAHSPLSDAPLTDAQRDLVLSGLKLAEAIAVRYFVSGRPPSYDDLVMSGVTGLIQAASLFDPDDGTPFKGFARPFVRRAVSHAIRDDKRLRLGLSIHHQQRIATLRKVESLLAAHDLPATPALMGRALDVTEDELSERWAEAPIVYSLNEDLGDTEHGPEAAGATEPGPEALALEAEDRAERSDALRRALMGLPELHRRVVLARFVEGQSPIAIARAEGLFLPRLYGMLRDSLEVLRAALAADPAFAAFAGRPVDQTAATTAGTAAGTVKACTVTARRRRQSAAPVLSA